MRHADRSTAVGETVGEFIDRLGLVKAGEAEMVVRAIDGDVLFAMFAEGSHECFEVSLAAFFAEVVGGEIRVHAGAIPVAFDWLAVVFDVDAVLFAEAVEDVAGGPDFVGSALGAFAEDLEFPLAFGDLGVDAFVVDAGV